MQYCAARLIYLLNFCTTDQGRCSTHVCILLAPRLETKLSNTHTSLSTLFIACTLFSSSSYAQTPADITDLLLVTGQSNVQGSGTSYDPVFDAVDPRVFAYTSNNKWEVADLHQAWDMDGWHPGNGSLSDSARRPYNSFAFHAARTIVQQDPSRVVGIVIGSAPGEGIEHWDSCGSFFNQVSDKAQDALDAQGVKTQFDGILWHQGESDWQVLGTSDVDATSRERAYAEYYPEKLSELMQNFRDQSWFGSNRAFICGETFRSPVNARLNELNNDSSEWTACAAGSDLSTRDGIHFDAAGLRTLGQRYGEAYLNIQRTATVDNSNPDVTITGPAFDGVTKSRSALYSGSATDSVSGVDTVRVAIQDDRSGMWFDFINEEFGDCFGSIRADIADTASSVKPWSISVDLPDGSYTINARSVDATGNTN